MIPGIFSLLKYSDNMAISAKDGVDVQIAIGNEKIAAKSCLKSWVMTEGRVKSVPPSAKVGAQYMTDKSKNKVAVPAFADDSVSQIPYP